MMKNDGFKKKNYCEKTTFAAFASRHATFSTRKTEFSVKKLYVHKTEIIQLVIDTIERY